MTDYLVLGCLFILIIVLIINLIIVLRKPSNENKDLEIKIIKTNNETKDILLKEIRDYNKEINESILKFEDKIYNNMDTKLDKINEKVETKLQEGFNKTNQTFENITERISRIDEAQKKIDKLSTNIISLQDILTDKKSRGTFGEIQLHQILTTIFGENNKKIYEMQKKLSNGTIADACLYTPKPLGTICIDSKFPLENYQRMMNKDLSNEEIQQARKNFIIDVKKHIDAIKEKYIIPEETASEAIMFLPAEAVYAEIYAYFPELVTYSQKSKVWLTSPTTIMATLSTIQILLRNIERDKYAKNIQEELEKLGVEFRRYYDRWDKFKRSFETVNKEIQEISTTSDKINKRFDDIQTVKLDNKE